MLLSRPAAGAEPLALGTLFLSAACNLSVFFPCITITDGATLVSPSVEKGSRVAWCSDKGAAFSGFPKVAEHCGVHRFVAGVDLFKSTGQRVRDRVKSNLKARTGVPSLK